MNPNLFKYIWQNSRKDQLAIMVLIAATLPFYWLSLEVPKRIVNEALQGEAFTEGRITASLFSINFELPDFLGGYQLNLFDGFEFDQIGYLLALSFLFLFFVLINGAFKYKINIDKGILAERMLRRLRFDLFANMMRFRPEDIRQVKPAEAATMINAEVEPIGGFIGDAFVWPVFLSTQALTAMIFIMVQSFWLGVVALAIVLVQAFVIPILRRKQLEYARQRQLAARELSGRIGEMVDGAPLIHGHGTTAFSEAEVGGRLSNLFRIRVNLYKRKYAVKYLNTLLSQITPFFFYAIGGYFALTGSLDIGQLVAVIAAYKDLPPPVKELIDWDQRRADVTIKYQQVISQFGAEKLSPADVDEDNIEIPATAPIQLDSVRVTDQRDTPLLESLTTTIDRPSHVALVGAPGSGREFLTRLLGRQITDFDGRLRLGQYDMNSLSNSVISKYMAYSTAEPILFPGTLRDNVTYSLQRHRPKQKEELTAEEELELKEAELSGNPVVQQGADWCDYAAAKVEGPEGIDAAVLNALHVTGLESAIYSFGLLGRLGSDTEPEALERIVDARQVVRQHLAEENLLNVIEPFDPDEFNRNASLGENLVFGVAAGKRLSKQGLASDQFFRSIIEAEGLEKPLTELGMSIAETTIETFSGLPPGHPLFERYALIQSSELEEFSEILEKARARDAHLKMSQHDYTRLISLALGYIEPRHRLGLVDPALEQRVLRARKSFMTYLPQDYEEEIEFYDPDHVILAAPIRDNLLFGRVAYGISNSEQKVAKVLKSTLTELGLLQIVYRLGLDYEVGPAGKLLFAPQRIAVNIARCVVRNPDILIVDGGLTDFSEVETVTLLANLQEFMRGKTLVVGLNDRTYSESFDRVIEFDGVRVSDYGLDIEKQPDDLQALKAGE
ncbi:MAG: ABC transporter transmembrane domain-containing protein [Hyphomicrobiaceae bacterium]